jgi:hypothetical protein
VNADIRKTCDELAEQELNLRAPEFAVTALESCARISADSRDKSLLTIDSD